MGRIKGKRLDIDAIISSYQNGGGNAVRVAKEFGCSHSYVLKLLKDRNIPVIPQTIVQRKRNVNEFFFETIQKKRRIDLDLCMQMEMYNEEVLSQVIFL